MLTIEQRDFLLSSAYNTALRAGAGILEVYNNSDKYDITLKTDKTPITLADRKSHNIIKDVLGMTRVPILSEEGREMLYEERSRWDLFWMVDPLDGTKEFIKGNDEFTVNIALMYENRPVISVVYIPYLSKIYFADRERGAFMKSNAIADNNSSYTIEEILKDALSLPLHEGPNQPIRIALSRSHNNQETFKYVDFLKMRFPDAITIEQGSSYKFCLLAEGAVDCYVRTTHTYEWDTAAGELILELSGGITRSLPSNEKLEYNKISLLNPHFVCFSKHLA